MDIVLVEGFKTEPYAKMAMVKELQDRALADELDNVAALISWQAGEAGRGLPVFSIDDTERLIRMLERMLGIDSDGRGRDSR